MLQKRFLMTKCSKFSMQPLVDKAIKGVFSSVNEHGILPPNQIPKTVLINPVSQSKEVSDTLCVNYINLRDSKDEHVDRALHFALEEEYHGAYGISLERQWPFQDFPSGILRKTEAEARLMNSVLFVLAPPKLYPIKYKPPGGK